MPPSSVAPSPPGRVRAVTWLALFALAAVGIVVLAVVLLGHDDTPVDAGASAVVSAAPTTAVAVVPASAAPPGTAPVTPRPTASGAPPSVVRTTTVTVYGPVEPVQGLPTPATTSIHGRLTAIKADAATHPPCIAIDAGHGAVFISQQTADYLIAVQYDPVAGGVVTDGSGIAEPGFPTSGRVLFHVGDEVTLTGVASTADGPDLSGTCGVTSLFSFSGVS